MVHCAVGGGRVKLDWNATDQGCERCNTAASYCSHAKKAISTLKGLKAREPLSDGALEVPQPERMASLNSLFTKRNYFRTFLFTSDFLICHPLKATKFGFI